MVDESHPYFADPKAIHDRMAALHNAVKHLVKPGGASGTFTSSDRRMEGYVATPDVMVGVWADLTAGHRISRAVFYRIVDGEPVVTEIEDVDWSYWDLVEQARNWSTER